MECSAFPVTAPSPSFPELPGSSAQPLSCPASAGIEAAPPEQRSEPGPEQLQGWEGALCPLPVAFGAQVSPEQPRSNPGGPKATSLGDDPSLDRQSISTRSWKGCSSARPGDSNEITFSWHSLLSTHLAGKQKAGFRPGPNVQILSSAGRSRTCSRGPEMLIYN